MKQRVKIELTFEADLDPVPGWGDSPKHWLDYVEGCLAGNGHYNPKTTIVSVNLVGPANPMAALVEDYLNTGNRK